MQAKKKKSRRSKAEPNLQVSGKVTKKQLKSFKKIVAIIEDLKTMGHL